MATRMPNFPPHLPPFTIEEYFDLEESTPLRHEFVRGRLYALAGERPNHNAIALNIASRVPAAARGGPCRVYMEGVMLRVGDDVYYPDVMVSCGAGPVEDRYENEPTVLVEVLSPSTERIDRGEKRETYLGIPSLRAYLIVSQEMQLVERYWRDAAGSWQHETVIGQGEIAVPCAEHTLTLTFDEIYQGVTLPSLEERRRIKEPRVELYEVGRFVRG